MGRKFKRGGRGGGDRAPRGGAEGAGNGDRAASYRSFPDVVKQHEKLERYYNSLIPLPDEEKTAFWDALKRELPNSFRFCGSKGHAVAVKRLLETRYIPEIVTIERYDGQPVQPPQPVPWYPDELAYSMNTPKQVIRKFPPFAAFQKFLVSETSVGNISRQEVVSMIPPLLMDVLPGMTVLDMCAAPGSKAAQLLEMVHVGEEARIRSVMGSNGAAADATTVEDASALEADPGDDGRATGLLVANDADYKRSHMLVHQLKRLSSPNLIVTNHDATLYPSIRLPRDPANPDKGQYLKFDRILADVPCSGDGTLRKNVNLWKDWQPGSAIGLHTTQSRILVRALSMLKVGGRVVYSTCSMNPVENEAVIVSAIERCGGPSKIDIVDCSDRLPGLKRNPGMHQWSIMDKGGRIWNNWDEVQQYALTKGDGLLPAKISETMFPRGDENECSSLALNRCMRVYAHQQDTGGFFITVLEKKAEFKAKPEVPQATEAKPVVQATAATGEEAKEEVDAKLHVEEVKAADGEPTDVLPANGVKRPRESEEGPPESEMKRARIDTGDEAVAKAETDPREMETDPKTEMEPKKTETEPIETAADVDMDAEPKQTDTAPTDTDTAAMKKTEDPNISGTGADIPKSEAPKPQHAVRTKGPGGAYEEPFKYISPDHEIIANIRDFYKISTRFPSDRYMVRNALGEPAKAIYYTSALARDILVENEGRGMKFVHGGVKMFMKQDAPSAEVCRWRIQSEGMSIIEGYVGPERSITLTNKDTFHKLLKEMFPKFAEGEWAKLNEIGAQARDIGMGCCVLRVEPDGSDPDFSERMVLPLWKSFMSLNLMLPKEDRAAMLLRLFNDTTPVINQTLKGKPGNQAKAGAGEAKVEEGESKDVKNEDVKNEDVKNEEVKNEEVKNGEVKNGEVKNQEVKNEEVTDEVKKEEVANEVEVKKEDEAESAGTTATA